jgi:hypothetical protein
VGLAAAPDGEPGEHGEIDEQDGQRGGHR